MAAHDLDLIKQILRVVHVQDQVLVQTKIKTAPSCVLWKYPIHLNGSRLAVVTLSGKVVP